MREPFAVLDPRGTTYDWDLDRLTPIAGNVVPEDGKGGGVSEPRIVSERKFWTFWVHWGARSQGPTAPLPRCAQRVIESRGRSDGVLGQR